MVLGIVGRYASEAAQPFAPRVEVAGLELSPVVRDTLIEALQSAWESTDPWAPAEVLRQTARELVGRVLKAEGLGDVTVEITVVDEIPFTFGS